MRLRECFRSASDSALILEHLFKYRVSLCKRDSENASESEKRLSKTTGQQNDGPAKRLKRLPQKFATQKIASKIANATQKLASKSRDSKDCFKNCKRDPKDCFRIVNATQKVASKL